MKGESRLPKPIRTDAPELTPETLEPRDIELTMFRTKEGHVLVCLSIASRSSVAKAVMIPEDFMNFADMVDSIRQSLLDQMPLP